MSVSPSPKGSSAAVRGLRANRLSRAICTLMSVSPEWQCTSTQLLYKLRGLYPNDRRFAAQTANGLGQHLRKLRPKLEQAGLVEIETARVGRSRVRMLYLKSLDQQACAEASWPLSADADSADNVDRNSGNAEQALKLVIASLTVGGPR
jgi:hypothetical protein